MTTELLRVGDWTLHPDRFSLVQGDEERVIGAQNLALLQFFAGHPNELLSRDLLLQQVWRGVVVNDNTLSKAIAELRKALGDESKQARYVVTVPRRGYRLVAPVSRASETVPAWRAGTAANDAMPRQRIAVAIAITLLLLALAALWRWQQTAPQARERFSQLTPFTSEPGMELQPTFSPDGLWIAYIAFPVGAERSEIRLKTLTGERSVSLPTMNGMPESPAWSPDGHYLAYLLRTIEGCQVHVARLAPDTRQLLEDKAISACMPAVGLGTASLQWSMDGMHLLFRKEKDGATPLVKFDWRSGDELVIADIFPYVFAAHPSQDILAYAEVGMLNTTLSVLDLQSGAKTSVLTRPEIFFGLAWDPRGDGILTTRSLVGGQLEYVRTDGRRELLLPSADSLIDPAFSADGSRLAVVQARMTYDLWQVEIPASGLPEQARVSAMPGTPLIQSNRFDYSPRFAHSGQRLAFLSTRSGTPEVWVANADGSDQRQALSLPASALPTHLRWSPDDRYLLLGTSDLATYRFDFISGQLQRLSPKGVATLNPTWSHDGKSIYASRQQGDDWFISRLELASGNWQPVANLAAAMAEASADGKSLYLLRHGGEGRRGLWRYDLQSHDDVQLLAQIERRNWQNFSVTNSGFYYLQEVDGMLTVHTWDAGRGITAILPVMSAVDAGPLWVDFAVTPDQNRMVYTLLGDFESDIMLLE